MSAGKHRAGTRRSRRTFHSALGGLLVAIVVGGQTLGFGAWLSIGPASAIRQVQAATLDSPAAPTATQVVGGKTVRLAWAAVTNATTYEVRYYTSASGGTATQPCSASGTTCIDPANRLGANNWYSVVARVGTKWIAESPRVRYTADEATTVAITALDNDTGSSPTDFITKTASNTLTGTSEANATVVITRSGSTIATATADGSGVWTSTGFALNEALQDLTATATDVYSNTAAATKTNIRLDTSLPTMSWTSTCTTTGNNSPVGGTGQDSWCKQLTRAATPVFNADTGSGLDLTTQQYQDNAGAWTNWSSGAIIMAELNGRVMQLRASDLAGNEGTTSKTYYIDGTKPTMTVSYPTTGLSLVSALLISNLNSNCGANKSACGPASDAVSGVGSAQYKLQRSGLFISGCLNNSGAWSSGNCSAFQTAHFASPNWDIAVNPATAYGGLNVLVGFTLTVHAVDAAGNQSDDVVSTWSIALL